MSDELATWLRCAYPTYAHAFIFKVFHISQSGSNYLVGGFFMRNHIIKEDSNYKFTDWPFWQLIIRNKENEWMTKCHKWDHVKKK